MCKRFIGNMAGAKYLLVILACAKGLLAKDLFLFDGYWHVQKVLFRVI